MRVAAWRVQTKSPKWVKRQLESEGVPPERIQALLAREYGEDFALRQDSRRWRRLAGLVLLVIGAGASAGLFCAMPGHYVLCGLFVAVAAVGLAIMAFPDAMGHLLGAILPR